MLKVEESTKNVSNSNFRLVLYARVYEYPPKHQTIANKTWQIGAIWLQ